MERFIAYDEVITAIAAFNAAGKNPHGPNVAQPNQVPLIIGFWTGLEYWGIRGGTPREPGVAFPFHATDRAGDPFLVQNGRTIQRQPPGSGFFIKSDWAIAATTTFIHQQWDRIYQYDCSSKSIIDVRLLIPPNVSGAPEEQLRGEDLIRSFCAKHIPRTRAMKSADDVHRIRREIAKSLSTIVPPTTVTTPASTPAQAPTHAPAPKPTTDQKPAAPTADPTADGPKDRIATITRGTATRATSTPPGMTFTHGDLRAVLSAMSPTASMGLSSDQHFLQEAAQGEASDEDLLPEVEAGMLPLIILRAIGLAPTNIGAATYAAHRWFGSSERTSAFLRTLLQASPQLNRACSDDPAQKGAWVPFGIFLWLEPHQLLEAGLSIQRRWLMTADDGVPILQAFLPNFRVPESAQEDLRPPVIAPSLAQLRTKAGAIAAPWLPTDQAPTTAYLQGLVEMDRLVGGCALLTMGAQPQTGYRMGAQLLDLWDFPGWSGIVIAQGRHNLTQLPAEHAWKCWPFENAVP